MSDNPLQNLPVQLFALFLGWTFTLYLQHKSNLRAEAIRRKDKIIDKIDKVVDWIEKQAADANTELIHIEAGYTALISQIEIRACQLSSLVRQELVSPGNIMRLRNIDLFAGDRKDLQHKVRDVAADLIEQLEMSCSRLYFEKISWWEKLNNWRHEFAGITFGLTSLAAGVLFLHILSKFIGWQVH